MSDLLRLVRLWRPQALWVLAGIGLSVLTILAGTALMGLAGWFLASAAFVGLNGYAAVAGFSLFLPAALVRALALLRVTARYGERLVNHDVTLRLLASLRVWLYGRLAMHGPLDFVTARKGDLLTRLIADIDALSALYLRMLVPLIVALAAAAIVTLVFAGFARQAAWTVLSGLVIAGGALPLAGLLLGRARGRAMARQQAGIRAQAIEGTQGMADLLVANAAGAHGARLLALTEAFAANERRAQVTGSGLAMLAALAGYGTLIAIALVAIPAVQRGRLAGVEFPLLLLATLAAFEMMAPLPMAYQMMGRMRASARRVFEAADAPSCVTEPSVRQPLPAVGDIVMEGLAVRYPGASESALQGIDLTIARGDSVVVTGASGAGKTTIANVLLRFVEYEGSVRIGGRELKDFRGEDVRERLAVVPQQPFLFHASLRDNLRLGSPGAPDGLLWEALTHVHLAAWARARPNGLDTLLGEGGDPVSGGEARRLAIARAILKDAPVWILDEPTEGLDRQTEALLWRDLASVLRGRTVLHITHRAIGLERADRVVVLAAGRLVEEGAFEGGAPPAAWARLV